MKTSILPKIYIDSPSGKFLVDIVGRLLSFTPSEDNPVHYTEVEHILNPYLPVQIEKEPHLETLIIPEGVKSLPAEFMRVIMNEIIRKGKRLAFLLRHDESYQFDEHGWLGIRRSHRGVSA